MTKWKNDFPESFYRFIIIATIHYIDQERPSHMSVYCLHFGMEMCALSVWTFFGLCNEPRVIE